jgi:hypothetical protein
MDGQALPRTRPAQPIGKQPPIRALPSLPLLGRTFTASQADAINPANCLCCLRDSLVPRCPAELGTLDPYAMQDDVELAGKRYLGQLGAASLGDPHCPAAQTTPAPMMHKHMSCLRLGQPPSRSASMGGRSAAGQPRSRPARIRLSAPVEHFHPVDDAQIDGIKRCVEVYKVIHLASPSWE